MRIDKKKAWIAAAFFGIPILTFMARYYQQEHLTPRKAAQTIESALPDEVKDAWSDFVLRRLEVTMIRRDNSVELTDAIVSGERKATEVPLDTKFQVECDSEEQAATVVFDVDGDAVTVPIFGPRAADDEAEMPPLSVERRSPAAVSLSDMLCQQIDTQVRALVSSDR